MSTEITWRVALGATLSTLALAGCDGDTAARADAAMDRTQERIAEAGAQTRETLSEAQDKLPPKLAAAGERIHEAGSRVAENIRDVVRTDGEGATRERPAGSTTTTITTGPRTSVSGISDEARAKLSDAAIVASIKADFLKDPDLSALRIDVDHRDGVVTLNGVADNEAARQRAAQLAGATKGVREVRNHLTVKRT